MYHSTLGLRVIKKKKILVHRSSAGMRGECSSRRAGSRCKPLGGRTGGWTPRMRTSMGIPCPSETGPTAPPSPAHAANTTTASALQVASGGLRLFAWSERGAARHDGIADQFCLSKTRSALSKAVLVKQLPGAPTHWIPNLKDRKMPTGEAWYHSKVDSLHSPFNVFSKVNIFVRQNRKTQNY